MRIALLITTLLLFSPGLQAQETTGALPASLRLGLDHSTVPTVQAAAFDAEAAATDDAQRDAQGKLPLYARFVSINATLATFGTWTELAGGDRLWRLRVASSGAQATELFFEDAYLPVGAQVHVYDDARERLLGGYTSAHVQEDGTLSTGMVMGEACTIEYFEPAAVRGEGSLHLVRIAHAYRNVLQAKSDDCEVDVRCSEGDNWTDERNSVVRIRVIVPGGAGYCTGTLMNNTANDCKGYILTAFHCTAESISANFGSYIFRFQHERTVCGVTTATGSEMTGCVFRAGSQDGGDLFPGGQYGSDYSLLEITSPIPVSFSPYWAGWDINATGPASGVCIHHPDADVKKISTFTSQASSTSWSGFTNGSHWQVTWVTTANGHGVTEPGSSGAPLFSPLKRVVGTLTGGLSCCVANDCGDFTGPNGPDKFGKLGYHWWENNPNPTEEELHWWLAPVNNPEFQNGSADPCGAIGMDELESAMPEVFPNPTSDRITVRLPVALQSADRIQVTDITGRVVHTERLIGTASLILDAGGWGVGTYLITVVAEGRRPVGVRVCVAK